MTTSPFLEWPDGLVLLLASASPRRAELLRTAGIPFEARPIPEAEPAVADRAAALRGRPDAYALRLAVAKAEAGRDRWPGRLVLGADTVVVLAGRVLEKPTDAADAARLLGLLSGRRHTVITAVALRGAAPGRGEVALAAAERTGVEFHRLTAAAIERYVATAEPLDKAGAYGIQGYGSLMVRRVEGCYFNVMGLPLARLGRLLAAALAGGTGRPAGAAGGAADPDPEGGRA